MMVAVGAALVLVTARSLAAEVRDPLCNTPFIRTVEPAQGKVGSLHIATGDCLGRFAVKGLFLTTGTEDFAMTIVTQSDVTITFRVADGVRAGRYSMMVLTAEPAKYIEQPVKFEVRAEASPIESGR
jgi:hypothetical protein